MNGILDITCYQNAHNNDTDVILQVKRLIWRLTSERIVRSLYLFACVYCAVKHCIYNLWGGMRLLIL